MFRGKSTFNLSSAYLIVVVVVVGVNNSNTINTVHNEEFSHFEAPDPPFNVVMLTQTCESASVSNPLIGHFLLQRSGRFPKVAQSLRTLRP